jgi:hypothetical protein
MSKTLIVVRPFGTYKVGSVIDNPAQIRETLEGEHAHNVVPIDRPGRVAAKRLES